MRMQVLGPVRGAGWITALAAATACGNNDASPRSCADDQRVHLSTDATRADVCVANGYTVIVRFQEAQTVETLLPLLDPIGGSLACDDPQALKGNPGKTCYIVKLREGLCCSEAIGYFERLSSPRASADVPHPETPCSCETHWTIQ